MAHERRVFVELEEAAEAALIQGLSSIEITLCDEDSYHLIKVLRLAVGHAVVAVSKNSGVEFSATVATRALPCSLKLYAPIQTLTSRQSVTKGLIFALGRNPENDLVCEKITELGAERIIFWQAERSIGELKQEQSAARLTRWRKIAEAAAKQSGRSTIPSIEIALNLEQLLTLIPKPLKTQEKLLLCSLAASAIPIRNLTPPPTSAHLLIGPAGDITEGEQRALTSFGFELVSLGTGRLRSETAAIAAVALFEGVWGHPPT